MNDATKKGWLATVAIGALAGYFDQPYMFAGIAAAFVYFSATFTIFGDKNGFVKGFTVAIPELAVATGAYFLMAGHLPFM